MNEKLEKDFQPIREQMLKDQQQAQSNLNKRHSKLYPPSNKNEEISTNSSMNKTQKVILVITALIIVGMMAYPPFRYEKYYIGNAGYSFITNPPSVNGWTAVVNVWVLIMQFFSAIILGGALFFAFKTKQ